ncbi:glutathione transferase GstA [Brevundimonas sp. BR2-1]|uniref:glutathione transferase GstA n=1 Tax=Brevundimonas sp. BR2-1 TaxID=3031123 RepID=UPI0030B70AAE
MKLFYSPGACSLATHIVLRELDVPFEMERVDAKTGRTETGADFRSINPKGQVAALQLDDGQVLTESAALLQYVGGLKPDAGLVPDDLLARARLQEQLNFIASELHSAFSPLFNSATSPQNREAAATRIAAKLDHIETLFADGRSFVLGEAYSVADAHLFVIAGWAEPTGIGLDRWPRLEAHGARIAGRPAVREAMAAEGLVAP